MNFLSLETSENSFKKRLKDSELIWLLRGNSYALASASPAAEREKYKSGNGKSTKQKFNLNLKFLL